MELRQHPRIPVDLHVSFAAPGNAGVKEGTMYDLSVGGCAVESITTVETGAALTLSIHAPDENTPITIESAAVRWTLLGEFGLEFIGMPEQAKGTLDRLVQTMRGSSSHTE